MRVASRGGRLDNEPSDAACCRRRPPGEPQDRGHVTRAEAARRPTEPGPARGPAVRACQVFMVPVRVRRRAEGMARSGT